MKIILNKILLLEEKTRFAKELEKLSPNNQVLLIHKNAVNRFRNLNDKGNLDILPEKSRFQILSMLHRKKFYEKYDKPNILNDMKLEDRKIQQYQLKNYEPKKILKKPEIIKTPNNIGNTNQNISLSNGGGFYGTLSTIKGNNSLFKGTRLADDTNKQGMQFYPDGKGNTDSATSFYATRNAIHSGDIPSKFTGNISGDLIQTTKKDHEIGIPTENLKYINNPRVRHTVMQNRDIRTYTDDFVNILDKYKKENYGKTN